jgi:hypothetical protein
MTDLEELKLEEECALLLRVKTLCRIYEGSAEYLGSGEAANEKLREHEQSKYDEVRKEALEIAISLKDENYRNEALHSGLEFCLKANDLKFATIIANAITASKIQEKVVEQHGQYFVLNKNDRKLQLAITSMAQLRS